MENFKKGKLITIIQEFLNTGNKYQINGIDVGKAIFFARRQQYQYELIPKGNYTITQEDNNQYLNITNSDYLGTIESIQIGIEFASISSSYDVDFNVDINILKDKYNQLVIDVQNLFEYTKKNLMIADALDVAVVLPQLDKDEVWVRTENGYRGLNIGSLEANIQNLIDQFKALVVKSEKDIETQTAKSIEDIKATTTEEVEKGKQALIDKTNEEIGIITDLTDDKIQEITQEGDKQKGLVTQQGDIEIARVNATGLDGKVSKSGDTMNGDLEMSDGKRFIGAHNFGYMCKDKAGVADYALYINAYDKLCLGFDNKRGISFQTTDLTCLSGQVWHEGNFTPPVDTIEVLKTMDLKEGQVVEVLGYYSKDDGATHKRVIDQADDGSGVQLVNGLWANIVHNGEVNVSWFGGNKVKCDILTILDNDYNHSINMNYGTNLKGFSMYSGATITPSNIDDYCIQLHDKISLSDLNISNPNRTIDKRAVVTNNVVNKFSNISNLHVSTFKIGMDLKTSMYNYYQNLAISNCEYAIKIGESSNWVGALTFEKGHIGYCNGYGISILSNSSNTIIFKDYIFEGVNICVQNYADVTFKNCYFGDTSRSETYNNHKDAIVLAKRNSRTVIDTCIFGIVSRSAVDKIPYGAVTFENNTNEKSIVEIANSSITVGAQKEEDKKNSCLLYTSNNKNNELWLDNATWEISKYLQDNIMIYPLYDYTCIKSHNKIKNYIIDGSLKTNKYLEANNNLTKVDGVVNHTGGMILKQTKWNAKFEYSIPKKFIGKEMVLEIYPVEHYGNAPKIDDAQSDFTSDISYGTYWVESSWNVPNACGITRYIIKPTKQHGVITFFINDYEISETGWMSYGAIILKTLEQKNNIGEVEDVNYPIELTSTEEQIAKLNTPYHIEKMKAEGVYDDFISYMDEKHAYDKQQEQLEKDKRLAYEEELKQNPELTYEEFLQNHSEHNLSTYNRRSRRSLMTENVEPQPSEALKRFMDKWL